MAFYIRALDFTDENMRSNDMERLMAGVRNNAPEMVPLLNPSANEKRRMMQHLGVQRTPGSFLCDEPVIAVPAGLDRHLRYFARKLTAAFYYRFMSRVLTADHAVMSRWFQSQDPELPGVLETLHPAWNGVEVGARPNVDFGDNLSVVWGGHSADDVFSYVAQFGTSLCFWGGAAPHRDRMGEQWSRYAPISAGLAG